MQMLQNFCVCLSGGWYYIMENEGIITQDLQIQGLLNSYFRINSSNSNTESAAQTHLDEDSLTAFVEGNLNYRESQPVVNQLVQCSFCRHVTTELIKLDYAFAEAEAPRAMVSTSEPASISSVLSGLLSRIFGTNDGAVFAHNETEEPEKEETEKKDH